MFYPPGKESDFQKFSVPGYRRRFRITVAPWWRYGVSAINGHYQGPKSPLKMMKSPNVAHRFDLVLRAPILRDLCDLFCIAAWAGFA